MVPRQPVGWRADSIRFVVNQFSLYRDWTLVQYSSWHTRTGIEWTGKKSYCQWGLCAGTEAAGLSVRAGCLGIFSWSFLWWQVIYGVSWKHWRGKSHLMGISEGSTSVGGWGRGGWKGRRQDEEEDLFMGGITMPLGEPWEVPDG